MQAKNICFPDRHGGHFTAQLRYIGGSTVFAFDDLPHTEFRTGMRRKGHLVAALYFLVGGEVTQDALYHQRMDHLFHNYGIKLNTSSSRPHDFPDVSLHPNIPGSFTKLPQQLVNHHFPPSHLVYHSEFQQGYEEPSTAITRATPAIQVTEDPLQEFYYLSFDKSPFVMHTVISEELPWVEPVVDMLNRAPHPLGLRLQWNLQPLLKLSL
jgi:hypothetical protein